MLNLFERERERERSKKMHDAMPWQLLQCQALGKSAMPSMCLAGGHCLSAAAFQAPVGRRGGVHSVGTGYGAEFSDLGNTCLEHSAQSLFPSFLLDATILN